MKQVKLLICIKDKAYGEKLLRFISGQHNPGMDAELLTGDAEELVCAVMEKTEMEKEPFVISDDENVLEYVKCPTIGLVTVPGTEKENEIFMYQKGKEIYRQILQLTDVQAQGPGAETGLAVPKVTCVYSPGESAKKTILALRTAMDRAERGSVLYVSLCGFPVLFQEKADGNRQFGGQGVSELMLCMEQELFDEKLEELTFSLGDISVLAPAGHFRDLFDFTQEEVRRFAERLKRQTLYDAVVIETGELFEFTFILLEEADSVLVPDEPGILAEIKRQVFQEYCRREGKEALWERMRFVPVSVQVPESREELGQMLGEKEGENEGSGGKSKKRENPKTRFGSGAGR